MWEQIGVNSVTSDLLQVFFFFNCFVDLGPTGLLPRVLEISAQAVEWTAVEIRFILFNC